MSEHFDFAEISEHFREIEMKSNIIYICKNDEVIYLRCPCGCNDLLKFSTMENVKPSWKIINNKTIKPSIQRQVGCFSHFSIIKNEIYWHISLIKKK